MLFEQVSSYTDPKYFALIISPVADCNLSAYYTLAASSADKLSLLRTFFGCLTNAVKYLHESQIRHRDIKPENILIRADRVLLTDFGISFSWENLTSGTTTADSGKTWVYAAPEVNDYTKGRNESTDIWSLGCVFHEMASVLKGESAQTMRESLLRQTENFRFYSNAKTAEAWRDKLLKLRPLEDNACIEWAAWMLQEDHKRRPTAPELFDTISKRAVSEGRSFCGLCCRDDDALSSDAGEDDLSLWAEGSEPTVRP